MRLIDAEEIYKKTAEWEARALEYVNRLSEQEGFEPPSLEWRKWTAILGERSAFKHDIMDAPTIDAVPVVRCKDCKHYVKSDAEHPDCDFCKRLICGTIRPDFFCADGERKEDTK